MNKKEYWKQRCLLAEKIIEASPCDPDITAEQIKAFNEYHNFIKQSNQNANTKTKTNAFI